MSKHLSRDLERLEDELVLMASMVEEMATKACTSFLEKRSDLAQEVIDADEAVDLREVQIEENCLKILALHQPVAIDLRRTATILKVNNDLERMADLAVNVAERALRMEKHREFVIPEGIARMAQLAHGMFQSAMDALIHLNCETALQVCQSDDEVDMCNQELLNELYQVMKAHPELIKPALHALAVARNIERMADLSTNIAEDVIYLVRGAIARHGQVRLVQ
jgi:phosphate transport system protein